MPLSFDEYTSRPVFFQPEENPQQFLSPDDNNLLEFGNAIFESIGNGWGFHAVVHDTADVSKYPKGLQVSVSFIREPNIYFIGFIYTGLYTRIEISSDIADKFCQDLPLLSRVNIAVRLGHALSRAIPTGMGHDVDPLDQEAGCMVMEFLHNVAISIDHNAAVGEDEVDFARWANDVIQGTLPRMIPLEKALTISPGKHMIAYDSYDHEHNTLELSRPEHPPYE